ncbi:MAG: methyl-accepting chemotaxis protein [Candidatus Aquicultor sp.]
MLRMKMNMSKKLYLAFGAMIALIVLTSVVIYVMNSNLVKANQTIIKHSEFETQMKGFQDEHGKYLNNLAACLLLNEKFTLTTNPHECVFGKWFYSYIESSEFKTIKVEEPELARLIESLEAQHRSFHETAGIISAEGAAGHRANVQKIYKQQITPIMAQLDGTYSNIVDNIETTKSDYKAQTEATQKTQNTIVLILVFVAVLLGGTIAFLMSRNIVAASQRVVNALKVVAKGNLTQKVELHRGDEIGEMATELDEMVENLSVMAGNIIVSSESVANAADQISAGNQELSQRTQEQASALEETASTIEEMTSTIKQTAENSGRANKLAQDAASVAQNGRQVVEETMASMGEVTESSKKIADIINVINEIAFQTNLLALNAAVEAARAGEQGKGFAVVAGEVRNLAQRSGEAAKEIQELINDSVGKVDKGNKLVEESGKTLMEIISSVKQVADTVSEISAAAQEQAAGIDQVNKAIAMMDDVVQQNAALVEESAAASQSLAMGAEGLQRLMGAFEVSKEYLGGEVRGKTKKTKLGNVTEFPRKETKLKVAVGAEDMHQDIDHEDFEEF